MFVGHYAVGFAGKRLEPGASLFNLITAAMLADILFSIFLVIGIEHVAIRPGITSVNALDLYDFPVSHMPLAPGVPKYFGLGMWNSVAATALIEGGMWFSAIILYVRATRARGRAGVYGLWIPLALLTILWIASHSTAHPRRVLP
jgi:hypothetical protein